MKSRISGTYQVIPKVGTERASQTDESASSLYKGKGESRLLPRETTWFFSSPYLYHYLIVLFPNCSKNRNLIVKWLNCKIIKFVPIEFRRQVNDAWTYGACDYSNSIRAGDMVTDGFELSML